MTEVLTVTELNEIDAFERRLSTSGRWLNDDTLALSMIVRRLLAHIRAVEAERDKMRFTAESLLCAFDTRPDDEPDWITQSTREAALNCARQDLGWPVQQKVDQP